MGDADKQKYLDVQIREYFAAVDEEKAEHKREKKREAARRKRANKAAAKRASSEASRASDTGQSNDGEILYDGDTVLPETQYAVDEANKDDPDDLGHYELGSATTQEAADNHSYREARSDGSLFVQGGNYGALRKIPEIAKAQMHDLKSCPAHALLVCECPAPLVDFLRLPPFRCDGRERMPQQ